MRWRLVASDTIAEVPLATMLDWATYRTVDRQTRREAAQRLVIADGLIKAQREEIAVLRDGVEAWRKQNAVLAAALEQERRVNAPCCAKADRLRGWATVGKVGGLAILGLGVLILAR